MSELVKSLNLARDELPENVDIVIAPPFLHLPKVSLSSNKLMLNIAHPNYFIDCLISYKISYRITKGKLYMIETDAFS